MDFNLNLYEAIDELNEKNDKPNKKTVESISYKEVKKLLDDFPEVTDKDLYEKAQRIDEAIYTSKDFHGYRRLCNFYNAHIMENYIVNHWLKFSSAICDEINDLHIFEQQAVSVMDLQIYNPATHARLYGCRGLDEPDFKITFTLQKNKDEIDDYGDGLQYTLSGTIGGEAKIVYKSRHDGDYKGISFHHANIVFGILNKPDKGLDHTIYVYWRTEDNKLDRNPSEVEDCTDLQLLNMWDFPNDWQAQMIA